MMKLRLLFLSMFAVLVVGAIAASGASAAPCVAGPASSWCLAIETLPSGALELVSEALFTTGKDVGTPSELEVEGLPSVVCEKEEGEGTLLEGGRPQVDKVTVSFKGNCHYTEHNEGCTFKEPITTVPVKGELTLVSAKNDLKLTPESGTFFAFVQAVGATCENAVKIVVTGEQLCEDEHLEEDLLTHLFFCPKSKGSLKDGTKNAALELDFYVALLGHPGDQWGAFEGME